MQTIERIDLHGVNAYLIKNNQKFILVDTGGHMFRDKEYTDRRQELINILMDKGVDEKNLVLILLTHGDGDHVYNASYIRECFHSKIAMHAADVFMVEKKDNTVYKQNANFKSPLFKLAFRLLGSKIQLLMDKVSSEFEPFTPDLLLDDWQDLAEFGFQGKILHCPGHTQGSICILDEEGNLISGDIFSNIKKPSLAANAQNFKLMRESAASLLKKKVLHVYPGHGELFCADEVHI